MRNIIHLLYKYNAVLVFIVLQVVCFALIFTYSSFHRSSYFNSSLTVVGWMKDLTHDINEPFKAMEENDQLREENALLNDKLPENYYRLEKNAVVINDTMYQQQFTYLPSQVIDNSYDRTQNYMLIDIGYDKGVKADMGVIGPNGIVGFVKDAGPKYSLVIPVINPNFHTAVKLKKNNYFGMIDWSGGDPRVAIINGLTKTAPVEIGDTVVTKGANGRFPEGLLVGVVKRAEEVAGRNDYDMEIELSTNFLNLHHAYVIVNKFKDEYMSIRDSIPQE